MTYHVGDLSFPMTQNFMQKDLDKIVMFVTPAYLTKNAYRYVNVMSSAIKHAFCLSLNRLLPTKIQTLSVKYVKKIFEWI